MSGTMVPQITDLNPAARISEANIALNRGVRIEIHAIHKFGNSPSQIRSEALEVAGIVLDISSEKRQERTHSRVLVYLLGAANRHPRFIESEGNLIANFHTEGLTYRLRNRRLDSS